LRRSLRPLIALGLLLALAVPVPVGAVVDPAIDGPAATYDTPKPKPTAKPDSGSSSDADATPKPTPKPTPAGTKKPKPTPKPTPKPIWATAPVAAALVPSTTSVAVGVDGGAAVRAPLQVALDNDYLEKAGFTTVRLVDTDDPIAALQSGELQFAVVDTIEAASAFGDDPTLQVIAGYENYGGEDGAYGGTVLVAAPALVAEEPTTVAAFTRGYISGLKKMAKAAGKELPALVAPFAPFNGGFGSRADEAGLGQLSTYLSEAGLDVDVEALVSEHTLNLSQASLGISPNPVTNLAGVPAVKSISVALPGGGPSPVVLADSKGYFESAGIEDVDVVDVQAPLLGVLQGELDFAVVDLIDALEGADQGLPLVAIAGHRNYSEDGTYGDDVLAVSSDFLELEGATVSAFLTAYVRALRDIESTTEVGIFGPFDGGFGDVEKGAGLAELQAFAVEEIGGDADVLSLVDPNAVQRAQTWWGLPANPADTSAAEE
jgi:ABC-type nitrate/sulfonate/bicarbonate transport system substrate-binding protein